MGNNKSVSKAKEPIRIRYKQLANGNQSIYLDCYRDGKREYEFLKLYIVPEKTAADKAANVETTRIATAAKAKRIVEMQTAAHGFSIAKGRSKVNLAEYIKHLADQRGSNNEGIHMNYMALRRHLIDYKGDKMTFEQVDKDFCLGFIEHLKKAKCVHKNMILAENTQYGYMKRLATVLNAAKTDEIIDVSPFEKIRPENKLKQKETERVYLTVDELKILHNTECQRVDIKNAFLFACFCGLRISDVRELTWDKLQKDNNGNMFIKFVAKKTQRNEYLPIREEAIRYLPKKTDGTSDGDLVFTAISHKGYVNLILQQWTFCAGIKKKVTFHTSRHTYATLLLSKGVRLEVVSKLLGHKSIKTTEIYAKIVDSAKFDAVCVLDGLLD